MKITFLGGGSVRLLPILRGVMQTTPEVFQNGEIRLCDKVLERAQAVERLVKASPEYKNVGCPIISTTDVDKALEGIDILYLTMAAVREPTETQAALLGAEYEILSSDQLSINGAFLSLRLAPLILSLAKKMEKCAPNGRILIFPNPVAVYSAMVNLYTSIPALGICGGFSNHRWDLTRLAFGVEKLDPKWDVVAAGVNHCSFIIRGNYDGEDMFSSLLPRMLKGVDMEERIRVLSVNRPLLPQALTLLYSQYCKYNTMTFSTEFDGMWHVARDLCGAYWWPRMEEIKKTFDPVKAAEAGRKEEEKKFADLYAASLAPEKIDFEEERNLDHLTGFAADLGDITLPILRAMAGLGKMRIVASRPNMGAVKGFADDASLEYTMDLDGEKITPVENQYVPAPFYGLVASLSEFQTLLARSLGEHDPKLFALALDCYPIHRFLGRKDEFIRRMFEIYKNDVDEEMKKALEFFR